MFYGNQKALRQMREVLDRGRLPHAVLIQGEEGLGKKTFARLFAGKILALGREESEKAHIRDQVEREAHPDFVSITPEGGARSFHIDAIRELLEGLYLAPNQSRYRVYLLAESHRMTEQAQNALLKSLEEPPGHAVFLLTCDDGASLLPTLLSRSYCLRLSPVGDEECRRALEEAYPGESREARERAAFLSGGNIGRAGKLLADEGSRAALDQAFALLDGAAQGSEYGMLAALAPMEKGRALAVAGMEQTQRLLGGVLREKAGKRTGEAPQEVKRLAEALSLTKILRLYDGAGKALEMLNGNVSQALALESFCGGIFAAKG